MGGHHYRWRVALLELLSLALVQPLASTAGRHPLRAGSLALLSLAGVAGGGAVDDLKEAALRGKLDRIADALGALASSSPHNARVPSLRSECRVLTRASPVAQTLEQTSTVGARAARTGRCVPRLKSITSHGGGSSRHAVSRCRTAARLLKRWFVGCP